MVYEVNSDSSSFTMELGEKLASILPDGAVICFDGDLGAGKTTFTKGIAKALGIDEVVTSPTFTFMKEYEGRINLYHFDMYRVEEADELYELGLNDYLGMKNGVCVIEWNKFENIKDPMIINIEVIDDTSRKIEVL